MHGGVDHTDWHAYANIGLMSKSTNETAAGVTAQYQGKPSVRLGGAYNLPDDQKVYGQLTYANFTGNTGAASVADREATNTILNVGYVRFLMPENATHLFYTAGLTFNNFKLTNTAAAGDTQSNRLFIPFVLGLESDVNDWWTWRASVTQNLLLDQTKTASVTNSNDPNSTVVAAGTGFKWKKLVLDATLASATTGNIDGNNLMANAGLTYIF